MAVGFTGGAGLKKALANIEAKLATAKSVRVGFLEDAKYPDGTQVAYVAAIQNFGAPEANIPARPFFSNMVREKSPGWGKSLADVLKENDYDAKKALGLMGAGIKDQLQQSITDTNDPPLKPATIKAKGFATPLIYTSDMLHSVGYQVDGGAHVLVNDKA
jgi:hypothetical protein